VAVQLAVQGCLASGRHRVGTVVRQQSNVYHKITSQVQPAVQTTVHEALIYSAFLRLPGKVNSKVKNDFVEEIMSVVELTPLRNAIVGLPGENRSLAASSMQSYGRSQPVSIAHLGRYLVFDMDRRWTVKACYTQRIWHGPSG